MQNENQLVQENIGLVIHIVSRFIPRSQSDFDDYVQEGCIGLLEAIRKYSINNNTKLSTYAWKSIQWEIIRHLHKNKKMAHLPSDIEPSYNLPTSIEEYLPDNLSNNEKQVVILKSHGYTLSDIAVTLSLSRGWVHQLYKTAIKKIDKAINA